MYIMHACTDIYISAYIYMQTWTSCIHLADGLQSDGSLYGTGHTVFISDHHRS